MADHNFLIVLLSELQDYEAHHGQPPREMQSFAKWMKEKYLEDSATENQLEQRLQWHGKGHGGKAHFTASNLLTALSRYKMNYVKMGLENTPFETYDEFAFLLSLVFVGAHTQSQLIEKHIQSKPTGSEVIRRLLRKGLIVQEPSDIDKRSKFLKATPEGRTAFHAALKKINAITDMVMAPLTHLERLQLLELLLKLDKPHREVYLHDKKLDLNALLEKFEVPGEKFEVPGGRLSD